MLLDAGFKFIPVIEIVCADELEPVVTPPNAREVGEGVSVGGGVQVITVLAAGVVAQAEENVVDAVVKVSLGKLRKSVPELAIPIVAEAKVYVDVP
jgi:hypothetical protein